MLSLSFTHSQIKTMQLKIGTRGSKLALWQAQHVADLLKAGGAEVEIVLIETKGDKILNQALSKIGSKGLFTAELEEQLYEQKIDLAVHSAKDLPSELPEGLEIIAFGERENPQDVLISLQANLKLSELDADAVIGTSSTRRVAMLRHYFPKVKIKDIRGNLQTRMHKLEHEGYDAIILAFAGVHRMGYHQHIAAYLPLDMFTPAVGQGSIAIEISNTLSTEKQHFIRAKINHSPTEACLRAERAFLKRLQGGCSVPVFGLAQIENQKISMHGGIIGLEGEVLIQERQTASVEDAEILGLHIAEKIFEKGGKELLQKIKATL